MYRAPNADESISVNQIRTMNQQCFPPKVTGIGAHRPRMNATLCSSDESAQRKYAAV